MRTVLPRALRTETRPLDLQPDMVCWRMVIGNRVIQSTGTARVPNGNYPFLHLQQKLLVFFLARRLRFSICWTPHVWALGSMGTGMVRYCGVLETKDYLA